MMKSDELEKQEQPVLVAISCLVYNHEPYLRDCLEGFVMQKSNFRFVAVVHDDVSTDNSTAIIREYAEKYPDIFKTIFETENQYSKHDGSLDRIMNDAIAATGAKYIAMCEGDDYWTDPYKLQKQVDFLESHLDFSMCFHTAKIKNETDVVATASCDNIETKEYFSKDIFPGWVIPTASVVYRRKMIEKYPPLKHIEWQKYGDIVLFLKCTHTGRVWGMCDPMSVYRMTPNGAVLQQRYEKDRFERMCNHYKFLLINFPKINKEWICDYIATYYYSVARHPHNFSDIVVGMKNVLQYEPLYIIKKWFRK